MIYLIRDEKSVIISAKTVIAQSFSERAFGLIIRRFNDKLDAMVFEKCNLIHSFFMSYTFDLIFINTAGKVVKLYNNAGKNKIFCGGKERNLVAVELPTETIKKFDIKLDDFLKIE